MLKKGVRDSQETQKKTKGAEKISKDYIYINNNTKQFS